MPTNEDQMKQFDDITISGAVIAGVVAIVVGTPTQQTQYPANALTLLEQMEAKLDTCPPLTENQKDDIRRLWIGVVEVLAPKS